MFSDEDVDVDADVDAGENVDVDADENVDADVDVDVDADENVDVDADVDEAAIVPLQPLDDFNLQFQYPKRHNSHNILSKLLIFWIN